MTRRSIALAAVALMGILTACDRPPVETVVVAGDYRIVGGPAPGIDQPYPGTIWAYTGVLDWQQAREATPVTHVSTDADGRFTMSLPPGRYTLFGAGGPSLTADGCGAPVVVDPDGASPATAHLVCSVP